MVAWSLLAGIALPLRDSSFGLFVGLVRSIFGGSKGVSGHSLVGSTLDSKSSDDLMTDKSLSVFAVSTIGSATFTLLGDGFLLDDGSVSDSESDIL